MIQYYLKRNKRIYPFPFQNCSRTFQPQYEKNGKTRKQEYVTLSSCAWQNNPLILVICTNMTFYLCVKKKKTFVVLQHKYNREISIMLLSVFVTVFNLARRGAWNFPERNKERKSLLTIRSCSPCTCHTTYIHR